MNKIISAKSRFILNKECIFPDRLNDYRKKNKLTNVELEVSGKLFPAHRVVLSLGSPVLEAAFSENWTQSKIYPLSEEHVDVEIMEDLLNFFYTGSIELTTENVYSVCMAAHFLQIQKLLLHCVNLLCNLISFENVLTFYVFSSSRNLDFLRTSCLEFICTDCEKVIQNPQILQITFKDFNDLIIFLKDQCFGTSIREQTFDCVVRWVETDLSERLNQLPVLLENIPLEEVSYRFLTQTVFTHPLVKESFPCIQNLLETLKLSSFEAVLPSELDRSNQDLIVISGRKSSDQYSSVMNYYHVQSQTWRKLPDMLQSRRHFAVAVMNQRDIIVSGGIVTDNDSRQETGSVETFCWESHTWQKLPDMPMTLSGHSMAVHNGNLYVAGGVHSKQHPKPSKVLGYSFNKREWNYVKPMTLNTYDSRLVAYRDHLYAINGLSGSVERYDSAQDKWTMRASMQKAPIYIEATVDQEKIYVCGLSIFGVYDPEANTWTYLPAPITDRSSNLVSLNDKLLVVTGSNFKGFIQEFDLETQQWKEFNEISLNFGSHYAFVGDY